MGMTKWEEFFVNGHSIDNGNPHEPTHFAIRDEKLR
jgi:hypothetical protein